MSSPVPVELEWFRDVEFSGGGRGGGSSSRDGYRMRIGSHVVETRCRGPRSLDVFVDPSVERVAYRCAAGERWFLAYRLDRDVWGHADEDPAAPWTGLGTGPAIAWADVADLRRAGPHLLVVPESYAAVGALRTRHGATVLLQAMADALPLPHGPSRNDPWIVAHGALRAEERVALAGPLRRALAAADSPPHAVRRVLEALAGESRETDVAALARVRLGIEPVLAGIHQDDHTMVTDVLLVRAARVDPRAASEAACPYLGRLAPNMVIAAGRAPCAGVAPFLERSVRAGAWPCGTLARCDAESVAAAVTAWIADEHTLAYLRHQPGYLALGEVPRGMGLMFAFDALSPELAARLERARTRAAYSVEQPASPVCGLETRLPREPCHCPGLDTHRMQTLFDAPAQSGVFEGGTCAMTIDDGARTIREVRLSR